MVGIAWLTLTTRGLFFFFFSSRRRHTRFDCDWSSDVCSSDLYRDPALAPGLRSGLEPSHQKLAGVLLEVRAGIRVTQDRQAGCQPGNGLRHDIDRKSVV